MTLLREKPFVYHLCGEKVGQWDGQEFILAHAKFGRVRMADFSVDGCPRCHKPIDRSNIHTALDTGLKPA